MNRPAIVFAALFAASAFAQELTLEQIMADPDWIGNGPEDPYWGDDSRSFFFRMKVDGEDRRQLHEMFLDGDHYRVYDAENMGERMADMSVAGGDWSRDGRRKVYIRGGDVYVRDLDAETTTQLTRTEAGESDPRFMADESFVQFRRSDAIRVRNVETGLEYEAAVVKAEDDPAEKDDESDYLAARTKPLRIHPQAARRETDPTRPRAQRTPCRSRPPQSRVLPRQGDENPRNVFESIGPPPPCQDHSEE